MFFIIITVLAVLAIGGAALASRAAPVRTSGYDPFPAKTILRIVTGALLALYLLFLALMSTTQVGARSIGIQTAFGKYQDTLSSGLQVKQPWSSVEQFSTRIQAMDLQEEEVVAVNFLGGGRGNVRAQVRWSITNSERAEDLWRKYQNFDNVRDQLVKNSAKDSFRVVFGKYTPVDARAGENLRPITEAVQADLQANLEDDGVSVDSISVQSIALDETTQKAIEATVTANQDIERAKAERDRARIDGETAQIRQREGALTGPALQRYCLDLVNKWDVAKNGPLPATFNCSLGGNDTPVIVDGRTPAGQ